MTAEQRERFEAWRKMVYPFADDNLKRHLRQAWEAALALPRSHEERAIQLGLTYRMAKGLVSVCGLEERKQQRSMRRNKERNWRPEPGKKDASAARYLMMQDITNQLKPQIDAVEGKAHGFKETQTA